MLRTGSLSPMQVCPVFAALCRFLRPPNPVRNILILRVVEANLENEKQPEVETLGKLAQQPRFGAGSSGQASSGQGSSGQGSSGQGSSGQGSSRQGSSAQGASGSSSGTKRPATDETTEESQAEKKSKKAGSRGRHRKRSLTEL